MSKPHSQIRVLGAIVDDSSRIFEKLLRSASKASKQSTSTLAGVAGGLTGMASVYGLTFIAPVELQIAGPIGSILGIIGAILIYRGRGTIAFERYLEQNRLAANEIMGRIKCLPKDAPDSIRAELWKTYGRLNSADAVTGNESIRPALPATLAPQLESSHSIASQSRLTNT